MSGSPRYLSQLSQTDPASIASEKYTPNEIEHDIIRKKFHDLPTQFDLNFASTSCPVLRAEAYTSEQLEDQARIFLSDEKRNRFDLGTKTAWLSSIFKWYRKDFGNNKYAALLAVAPYAPTEIGPSIEAAPKSWTISYLPYN